MDLFGGWYCRNGCQNNISNIFIKGEMTKYNIKEKAEKRANYRSFMNPSVKDELQEKIRVKIIIEEKYKDKDYSATKLAEDLGTNVRYISAVCAERFYMSYCELVNYYRVNEAMTLLTDRRYLRMRVEDISEMVGFSNRQSFYVAFYRLRKMTPRQYKMQFLRNHPELLKAPSVKDRSRKTA